MGDDKPTFHEGGEESRVNIGEMLANARQERGLSLQEVEQATKIRKRYLDGLEREDYSVLPDAVYAQGFLKTYANYLGLDGEGLSRELKRRRGPRVGRATGYGPPKSEFEEPLISPGGLAGAEKSRIAPATLATLAVVVVAVAAVIGSLYYVGLSAQAPETPEKAASEGPAGEEKPARDGAAGGPREQQRGSGAPSEPTGEREAASGEPAPAPQPDVLRVAVSVEGAPSWLSIQADGSVVYEALAQPGFSQTFEADQAVSIHTGNAGAVHVEVNGQDLGLLGADGEVLIREFTKKEAS